METKLKRLLDKVSSLQCPCEQDTVRLKYRLPRHYKINHKRTNKRCVGNVKRKISNFTDTGKSWREKEYIKGYES